MELSVKAQLEKEPNLWIRKTLTVLFVIAIMLWAAKSVA
ncbi:MAG TPA: phosphonate ABC transporter, permease protein PhnE, partial [Clostridium sp.]|nr:phosphonate ABC transporter, permease protein PhnE [Clostridium sp.]